MNQHATSQDDLEFIAQLNKRIAFQRKWRLIMMTTYTTSTVFILIFSSSASILAAFGINLYASIAAGATSALIAAEKGLLFREKWKLHITIQTNLENIKLLYETQTMNRQEAAHQIVNVMERYSTELPISSRD